MPRHSLKRSSLATILASGLLAGSCGGDGKAPTQPEKLPNAAALIPAAPAPQPTPTPTPGTGTDEEPLPAITGGEEDAGSCGAPEPPPVSRINVKLHGQQSDRALLDATPLVGPDAEYCQRIGFTDGRSFCPVRPEGSPERSACEEYVTGRAADTGRAGPTWSANGRPCNGPDGGGSCSNHPGNQYLAYAYGAGRFRACAASGVCGEIALP